MSNSVLTLDNISRETEASFRAATKESSKNKLLGDKSKGSHRGLLAQQLIKENDNGHGGGSFR